MVDSPESASAPCPPPLGTLIDNDTLELVEVLGYGGYGVVYRAVDIYSPEPVSYAVKCLPHSQKRNSARQRQLHMREIALHQLASRHSNVVTLHRVVEDYQYTFIVMDYCSDGDLFSQILHHRRYLGNDELIKKVFLQLLDAVEHCHNLGIFHRDLKPENVLCFDGGLRLAITDFGLATTDRMSTEFRTGSVYHMSPECQGGVFAPTKSYSPLFNDIWSLGIILLNLITGRNPWKSAAADDCTFQAYLRDPAHFLPTVLPISEEVNRLLVRTLEVDWRRRITVREMRAALQEIRTFYSPDVLFEDSMARCPWEAAVNIESDSGESLGDGQDVQEEPLHDEDFVSSWSGSESESELVFAHNTDAETSSWADSESDRAHHHGSYARSMSPSPSSPLFTTTKLFDALQTPSNPSTYSIVSSASIPSLPATPGIDATFSQPPRQRPTLKLTLNTNDLQPTTYYDSNLMMISARSSSMHTALESQIDAYGVYSPYLSATIPEKASLFVASDDVGMRTTPVTRGTLVEDEMKSTYTYPTIDGETPSAARPESPVLGLSYASTGSITAVERFEYNWDQYSSTASPIRAMPAPSISFLNFSDSIPGHQSPIRAQWSSFSYTPTSPVDRHAANPKTASFFPFQCHAPPASPPPLPFRRPLSPAEREREQDGKARTRTASFLNPIRLAFPRRSSSPLSHASTAPRGHHDRAVQTEPAPVPPPVLSTNWAFSPSTSSSPQPQPYLCLPPLEKGDSRVVGPQRVSRRKRMRSARDWFSPSKFFSAVLT